MAAEKVTDRPALPTPDASDIIHVVDVSDLTDGPAGTSKKATLGSLPGGGGGGGNIYDTDGQLTNSRILDVDGKELLFVNSDGTLTVNPDLLRLTQIKGENYLFIGNKDDIIHSYLSGLDVNIETKNGTWLRSGSASLSSPGDATNLIQLEDNRHNESVAEVQPGGETVLHYLDKRPTDRIILFKKRGSYHVDEHEHTAVTAGVLNINLAHNTTDATPQEMTIDANNTAIKLKPKRYPDTVAAASMAFEISVIARQSSAADSSKFWKITGIFKRTTPAVTVSMTGLNTTVVAEDAGAATWLVNVTADAASEALKIEVQGEAGKNINWFAECKALQTFI